MAQKAKIKWAVEGDENSGFFHEVNERVLRHVLPIVLVCRHKPTTASISLDFPNQISHEQSDHMEREVSNDEIKKSVWECGTDKAPGPDGFTFGFFRHFWHLVDRDVCEAVRFQFKINNVQNAKIMGMEVDNGKVNSVRATKFMGFLFLKLLFYNLGSYVGGVKIQIQSWKDIIDRIEAGLSRWNMKMFIR
ncbi:hypothetical protein Tco_0488068 [Tanacetum coccineum]